MKKRMKSFWTKKYKQNIAKMIGVCYRYVPVRETAEDIAHDAFLTAIEKADTYKGLGSFEAWLMRITVNKALAHLRQERKAIPLSTEIAAAEEDDDSASAEGMMAAIRQADFTQEEIMEAIAQLPEHHRTVLNLYIFERYTHQQIANLMGISVNTSKSHLLRARRHLQKILFEKSKQRKPLLMFMIPLFSNPDKAFDRYCRQKMAGFSISPQDPIAIGEGSLSSPLSLRLWMNAHTLPIIATGVLTASGGGFFWANHSRTVTPDVIPPISLAIDSLDTDIHELPAHESLEAASDPASTTVKAPRTSRPLAKEDAVPPSDTVTDTPKPVVVKKVVRKNRRTVVIQDSTQP